MNKMLLIMLVVVSAVALSGCGQRVYPADPQGKIRSSSAY